MKIKSIITWNGKYYGISETRKNAKHYTKYYKSDNGRFEDGKTEEITFDEYHENAIKYAKVFCD